MDLANLSCIDLNMPAEPGFHHFMSAWLYADGQKSFLVDPGPLATLPQLLEGLENRGVKTLDYILLTHIHIDHAGATGAVVEHFPTARVVCHPDGVAHLVNPAKLWAGSRKVLGRLADAYGEILAVPAQQVGFAEEIGSSGLRAFVTPGHAPHHCCYLFEDLLFAGEVAGVRCEIEKGIYMRPATPPKFILEVARDSIERMIALSPGRMVFAHYGLVDAAVEHLQIGRDQLDLWVEGIKLTLKVDPQQREAAFFDWLIAKDPVFGNIRQLSPDIYQREKVFLRNTWQGMLDYVTSRAPA